MSRRGKRKHSFSTNRRGGKREKSTKWSRNLFDHGRKEEEECLFHHLFLCFQRKKGRQKGTPCPVPPSERADRKEESIRGRPRFLHVVKQGGRKKKGKEKERGGTAALGFELRPPGQGGEREGKKKNQVLFLKLEIRGRKKKEKGIEDETHMPSIYAFFLSQRKRGITSSRTCSRVRTWPHRERREKEKDGRSSRQATFGPPERKGGMRGPPCSTFLKKQKKEKKENRGLEKGKGKAPTNHSLDLSCHTQKK